MRWHACALAASSSSPRAATTRRRREPSARLHLGGTFRRRGLPHESPVGFAAGMHRHARGSRSCHVLLELRGAARSSRARLSRSVAGEEWWSLERQRNVVLSAACGRSRGGATADRSTVDARRHRGAARVDRTSDRRQPQRHHHAAPRPLRGGDEAASECDAGGAAAPPCSALTAVLTIIGRVIACEAAE